MHFSARSHHGVWLSILVFFFVQHVVNHVHGVLQPLKCSNNALVRLPIMGIPLSKGYLYFGLTYLDPVDQLFNHCVSLRQTNHLLVL